MTALIFDTETHKLHGDLIEAAFIGIELLPQSGLIRTQTEFCQRYKPSEPISIGAMAIHHIIDEDLEKCPAHTDFSFPSNLNVQYLIGHNIDYDIDTIAKSGINTAAIKTICTLAMARYLWPTIETHNLSALAYHTSENRKQTRYNIKNAHNALIDCETTFTLLKAIIKAKAITSIEELYQFSQQARIPSHIFYGKHKGKAIKDLETSDIKWLRKNSKDSYLYQALDQEIENRLATRNALYIKQISAVPYDNSDDLPNW